jgi:phage terminase large subunit
MEERKIFKLPYPHSKQLEVFLSKARFKVTNFGRRSGKSFGHGEFTFLSAIEKQGNYWIVAPTYRQAKDIFWDDVLKTIIPPEWILSKNENELSITLKPMHYKLNCSAIWGRDIDSKHDPNLPPSKISLKGVDNPDSLRGVALDGLVGDEAAFWKNGQEIWDKVLRPALADRVGWAIISSTPDGVHNWFYDFCLDAQNPDNLDWEYFHATALDNPYFDRHDTGEWAKARESYEKRGKIDEWVQEWEARFSTPQSLVYREFSPLSHVVSPQSVPHTGTFAMGMDFGWNDPFAVVFILIDKNGNWWVYDEIYEPELITDQRVKLLKNKMGDNHFTRIIGDSADTTEIQNLKKRGIPVRASFKGKGSIKGGIGLVRNLIHVRESTGMPKLFVTSNCKNLIRELGSYSYTKNAWGEITDTPEGGNDHLLDSLRYVAIDLDKATGTPPKARKSYSATGRLLS